VPPKLFVPGPTEVLPENLAELSRPQIPHRGEAFRSLYQEVQKKLQGLLETRGTVFLFTSSSTGLWEATVRNCVRERILVCVQGAFSQRWYKVAVANGKRADCLLVPSGHAIRGSRIEEALDSGRYDAIAVVHNETSTGVMNPMDEIASVVRRYPDVIFLVDAVSSMGGVRIPVDDWEIDVCFAGVQKAFALPPGLTVASVSARALKKAAGIPDRGYYFDLIEFADHHDRHQTPATPAIPLIHALNAQLDRMFHEGLSTRFERHERMANAVRRWALRHFELFAEEGHESPTVTCVRNTRGISVTELMAALERDGMAIANGYGELRDGTFRIGHMGDLTEQDITELLERIDGILGF
jgi:aspartate aminotransferase-like enzyme